MSVPKVTNMDSPRTGKPVANQFIISVRKKAGVVEYFQSYSTIIALRNEWGNFILDKNSWDYSVTTLKYLKEFIQTSDSKTDIARKIKNGDILTADLNKGL